MIKHLRVLLSICLIALSSNPSLAATLRNDEDVVGWKDLFRAISNKDPATVRNLLRAGISPNLPRFRGNTPLIHSEYFGSFETSKALIDFGADPFIAQGLSGKDAVKIALELDHEKTVEYISEIALNSLGKGQYLSKYSIVETVAYIIEIKRWYRQADYDKKIFHEFIAMSLSYPNNPKKSREILRYYLGTQDKKLLIDLRWACDQVNEAIGRIIAVPVPYDTAADVNIKMVSTIPNVRKDADNIEISSPIGQWRGISWSYGEVLILNSNSRSIIRQVMLHELLHSFGLDHTSDKFSIMHAESFPGIDQRITPENRNQLQRNWLNTPSEVHN